MGCFNEVEFRCSCGEYNRVQTKSGSCELLTFSQDSVPVEEVEGLGKSYVCWACNKVMQIINTQERVYLKSVAQ